MRLYTLQKAPNITNQIRDYLYEMDARVESLINYTDIKNPNWDIINKKYNGISLVPMSELLKESVIILLWYGDKLYTALSINKLKLHKGLVNEFGSNVYYWLLDDSYFDDGTRSKIEYNGSEITSSEEISDDQERAILNWLKKYYSGETISFTFYIWNPKRILSVQLADELNNYINKIVLLNQNNQDNEFRLENDVRTIYVNPTTVTNNKVLIPAQEGTVIFCNYLNENIKASPSDPNRNIISSYKIFSLASASDLYIPSSKYTTIDDNTIKWQWNFIENATETLGTNYIFHLPGPSMRLYIHSNDSLQKLNPFDTTNSTTIVSMSVNSRTGEIVPNIASKDGVIWTGFDNNIILSKIYNKTTIGSKQEYEEVFFDQEIINNDINIENYQTSSYTITVKHNILPNNLQLYLNIM